MKSISELALKGHFEELKKEFSKKEKVSDETLDLISQAVGIIEDFYEHNPEAFKISYYNNYREMISFLNNQGYSYNGHPDLVGEEKAEDLLTGKKPMQKAGVAAKQKEERKKRNAG